MLNGELQLSLLFYAPPGEVERCVGVFIYNAGEQRLTWKIVNEWSFVSDPFFREYVEHLSSDFAQKAETLGGAELLAYLEDTLSNIIRISDRQPLDRNDSEAVLDAAFAQYVQLHRSSH